MTRKRKTEPDLIVSAAGTAPARRKTAARTRAQSSPEVVETAAIIVLTEPSREEIAALAYSFWEARGCHGGSPEEDWIRAEEQLRTRASVATA